jgi:2-polyprenyl-3-methyl-5-hydroxy-6-metoxy-1,4-benzoquinol methylase
MLQRSAWLDWIILSRTDRRVTIQANKIAAKYAPLVGTDQFGCGNPTDELQFWNYGLWRDGLDDPKQASQALLAHLIGQLPPPPARILDVAFGQGGSLKSLCAIYGAANVVGINIAEDQIRRAKSAGLACRIMLMDAAEMSFEDQSFDGILCMEAAFHFRTRQSFLSKALRMLRPGGRMVLSDFLLRSGVALDSDIFPPENIVGSLDEYRALYRAAGFPSAGLEIRSTATEQLVPFIARMAELAGYLPRPDPEQINIEAGHSREAILFILTRLLNIADTVVVCARREPSAPLPHAKQRNGGPSHGP